MIEIDISEIYSACFMCVLENFILIIEVLDFGLLHMHSPCFMSVYSKRKKMKKVLDFDAPATGWHYKLYKRRRWKSSCGETRAAETVATWHNQTMQTAD